MRPRTFVDRIPVDWDNTYDARMRGDAAVPSLFNGNFDAVFNPQGLTRIALSKAIPGWSLHNGETSESVSTSNLVDVNQLSASDAPALHAELDRIGGDRTSANYALKLESGKSITHNRFLVPESGVLRFNLHVPDSKLNKGGKVLVTIEGDGYQKTETINLENAGGKPSQYLADTLKVGYGTQGFETFHVDIPEQLRAKVATLKFEVTDDTVYLDDVFFKSTNLRKDVSSTYLMTNIIPQHLRNNQFNTAWRDLEKYGQNTLVASGGKEISIIAGGYGSLGTIPPGFIDRINVPEYTWKTILVLDNPGQSIEDVTTNTRMIAVITPNIGEPTSFPHTVNLPANGKSITVNSLDEWQTWQTWRVSTDYVEKFDWI